LVVLPLWGSGRFSNREIGSQLGISYSNVNRHIMEIRKRPYKDKSLRGKYKKLNTLIEV